MLILLLCLVLVLVLILILVLFSTISFAADEIPEKEQVERSDYKDFQNQSALEQSLKTIMVLTLRLISIHIPLLPKGQNPVEEGFTFKEYLLDFLSLHNIQGYGLMDQLFSRIPLVTWNLSETPKHFSLLKRTVGTGFESAAREGNGNQTLRTILPALPNCILILKFRFFFRLFLIFFRWENRSFFGGSSIPILNCLKIPKITLRKPCEH